MNTHQPEVKPYVGITDGWVVQCPCGLNESYMTEDDAQARADQHLEETP